MDEIIKTENIEQRKYKTLPAIALRGKVLFPNIYLNFDVGRPMSVTAVNVAQKNNDEIFISFVITKPNIFIPEGTIANIESTGLVGSRSLELYPPTTKPNKPDELLIPINPERVQGAFENSTRIAEVLHNASSNVNKSINVKNIPTIRELINKSYKQSIEIETQLQEINKQETNITKFIKDNEKIKKINTQMENFIK